MTGYITPEGASLPAGTDNWDVVAAFRTMANSQRTIVGVPNRAGAVVVINAMIADGRAPSAANPLVVYRSDTDVIETWDGTTWWGATGYTNDYTAWVSLTLVNSWVPYVGGGGYYSGLRCRVLNDVLQINGMIKGGATGSIVTTLPTNYIPQYTAQIQDSVINIAGSQPFTIAGLAGGGGSLTYNGSGGPTFLSVNLFFPMS